MGIMGKIKGGLSKFRRRKGQGGSGEKKVVEKKVVEEKGGRTPPPYWSFGGGGFGGGFGGFEAGPILKIILIIIIIVAIGFGGWWLWNSSGAGQASSGGLFSIKYGFSRFMESSGVRAFWWQITHPFEIQPEQAKEEQTNPKYQPVKSLRESLSVSVDVSPLQLEYGQKAGIINIKINNEGTQDIKEFKLLVLPIPDNHIIHCLGPGINNSVIDPSGVSAAFDCDHTTPLYMDGSTPVVQKGVFDKDLCGDFKEVYTENHSYILSEYNNSVIVSGGTKVISLEGVSVDDSSECTAGKKAWVPTAYPFYVRIITPYIAASRLPITFLNMDYGTLLYRQGELKQSKVPATAMAGTAVKINIDAGLQPILINGSIKLPIIFNFENMGSGRIIGNPVMVLIIPKNFGICDENYYYCNYGTKKQEALDLIDTFNSTYYPLFASFAQKEINWIAKQARDPKSPYYFCVMVPQHEFQAYSCTLSPKIDFGKYQKRVTDFVTAFAVYDYEAETAGQMKAYTISSSGE